MGIGVGVGVGEGRGKEGMDIYRSTYIPRKYICLY